MQKIGVWPLGPDPHPKKLHFKTPVCPQIYCCYCCPYTAATILLRPRPPQPWATFPHTLGVGGRGPGKMKNWGLGAGAGLNPQKIHLKMK